MRTLNVWFTRKSGDCGVRNKLCCFSQRRKVIIYVIFNLKKKPIQASKGIWVNSFARLKTIHIPHQIIIFPLGLCEKKFGLPAPRSQKQTTSHIIHSSNSPRLRVNQHLLPNIDLHAPYFRFAGRNIPIPIITYRNRHLNPIYCRQFYIHHHIKIK